jgi:hypothetical protein
MNGLRYYRVRGVDLAVAGTLPARSDTAAAGQGHQREARPVRLPGLAGAPQTVIRQRVASLDVVFAIDDSESVHGPDGTDPGGARNAACLSVIDLMHRYGGGRAGVVHWGDTAPASMALAPLPVHRGRLRRGLRIQPVLGGTQPAAALARVRKLIQGTSSGRALAVLLITDGQDLGAGLEQALGQLPARSVHLILVDPSGDCWGQEAAWRELPWGSFTRLENLSDRKRLAWESGAVIARSIGLKLSYRTSGRTQQLRASHGEHRPET